MKTIVEARSLLPEPASAWRTCVALAALARLYGEEEHRFALVASPDFSHFHLADGGGLELDAVFSRSGVLIRGFDHESPMSPWMTEDGRSWPGLYDELPPGLVPFVTDPARLGERGDRFPGRVAGVEATLAPTTFATWWERGAWQCGRLTFPPFGPHVTDGAAYLFDLAFQPETWAREYGWEAAAVAELHRHDPARGAGLPDAWGYGRDYPYALSVDR